MIFYLVMMAGGTLLSWGAWYFVISTITPSEGGMIGLALFYGTLTLSTAGTCALAGLGIRMVFLKQELILEKIIISFRQGIFLALLIDGILLLQALRVLTWYNMVLLVVGITVVEFFVISIKSTRE